MLEHRHLMAGRDYPFGLHETARSSYEQAVRFWGDRELSDTTRAHLVELGDQIVSGHKHSPRWQQVEVHQQRANLLRNIVPMSADWMTA